MKESGIYTYTATYNALLTEEPLFLLFFFFEGLFFHICSLRFSPQEKPPQAVELDDSGSVETSLLLLYPVTEAFSKQNVFKPHTQMAPVIPISVSQISSFNSPLDIQFELMDRH